MYKQSPRIGRLSKNSGLKLVGLVGLTVLTLMACTIGGTTASSPPGTPQCLGGPTVVCVTAAWWSHLDETVSGMPVTHVLSSQPMGIYSDIGFDSSTLICNAACITEHGFIGNYVALLSGNLNNFIEVGYRADGAAGGTPYLYWADYPSGGSVTYHNIGSTGSSANNFVLEAYAVSLPGGVTGYSISTQAVHYSGGVGTVLSSYSPPQALEMSNILSGGPNAIEVGEKLHGQNGEAATWQLFDSPLYATSPLFTPPVGTAPGIGLFSGTVQNNAFVQHASPPYGNLFWSPSTYPGKPGLFDISCCTAP